MLFYILLLTFSGTNNELLIGRKKRKRDTDADNSDDSSATDPYADSGSSYFPSDLEESSNEGIGMFYVCLSYFAFA